ncbi:nuclease-sensitive element-binding protein 1 [Cricetulus griseus]|nr:nuclease-sensitive element-binding protein 1 [Cricetulus griseus]
MILQGPSSPKTKDGLERTAMKRTRKVKGMRPRVSSHFNVSIATTSIANAENPKPQGGKETKAPDPPAGNSSSPGSEQSRAE